MVTVVDKSLHSLKFYNNVLPLHNFQSRKKTVLESNETVHEFWYDCQIIELSKKTYTNSLSKVRWVKGHWRVTKRLCF